MDDGANVDAVKWFASEIFPRVLAREPNARFYIVGSNPTGEVRRLASTGEGVLVTGRVDDVRPYIAWARASVAPLRIARGVQNKVLEAFAMARPVIGSPEALEGLAFDSPYPWVANDSSQWSDMSVAAMTDETSGAGLGRLMRDWVVKRYAWDSCTSRYIELLEDRGWALG
jgi:glycosyltransferase involved in cell wall biosynthesis